MIYRIDKEQHDRSSLEKICKENPNIRFVSLMAVDLGGNSTDEKIPIELFLKDTDAFLVSAVQTDGSSVELYDIATLNDAKVDLMPDPDVPWFIDYNLELTDTDVDALVGTIRIPAFLIHNNKKTGSRGVLYKAESAFKSCLIDWIRESPELLEGSLVPSFDQIKDIRLTTATELEFWVNTPEDKADLEKLSISQSLKEQYWKRTRGLIRTCLEKTMLRLQAMGIEPEMAHKEVGGVRSKISVFGKTNHAMEQLEISWKYASPLMAADIELQVREIIEDTFTHEGLEVTFKAKPIRGVAGSGAHTHFGVAFELKDGRVVNAFAPKDMKEQFMNRLGYGALMGLLKNYEVISPFVTSTIDGFHRLVPGFEAPVCTVASLGHRYDSASRNRSVLVGLCRDMKNPASLRLELRSPNPLSNKYLAIAATLQAMLDGIRAVKESDKSAMDLEKELSKPYGVEKFYLEKNRAYRAEDDIFVDYSEEERAKLFGTPPATVYENMMNFEKYPDKVACLLERDVFSEKIIASFQKGAVEVWRKKLASRILERNRTVLRSLVKAHHDDSDESLDTVRWQKIDAIRRLLMVDTLASDCLFTKLKKAANDHQLTQANQLSTEIKALMDHVIHLYLEYKSNLL